jgi:hypothetical protein
MTSKFRRDGLKLTSWVLGLSIALGLELCSSRTYGAEPHLCRAAENVVFSCLHNQKIYSVCVSKEYKDKNAEFQYRVGTGKYTEMKFPANSRGGAASFRYSNHAYAAGGETHLSFSNSEFRYVMYDRTISKHPSNGAEFDSGILVIKGEKIISNLRCMNTELSSIDGIAQEIVPPEPYTQFMGPRLPPTLP